MKEKKKKWVKIVVLIVCLIAALAIARPFYVRLIDDIFGTIDKPVIYLYPEEDKEISVTLGNKDAVTVSYPKYEDGWKVLAKPDGTLTDLNTGRELYSLYYESEFTGSIDVKTGFVVKGDDCAGFLEEKLEQLGLTARETEEFIIYWLPKLEAHPYNLIRFLTREEIGGYMPLRVSPEPENEIRILMAFKGLEAYVSVPEQELPEVNRSGYTLVEWGGIEM